MNDSRGPAGRPTSLVPAATNVPVAHPPYGYGPVTTPLEEVHSGPGELTLLLLEFWRVLTRRKWLIASMAVAAMLLGGLATMMTTPLYTATVRLQIDRNVAKIVDSGSVIPIEGSDAEFQRTQHELLRSRAMAERVASVLNLGEDAEFLKPRGFSIWGAIRKLLSTGTPAPENPAPPDKAALARGAAGVVMANRGVQALAGSRLVDITYSDPNPARAQRIATAYAEA